MRAYARPGASERGDAATSSERRSHSALGKAKRHPSWPMVRWLAVAIVVVALIDLPLPRAIARTEWRQPSDAAEAIRQLHVIPSNASVLAQPNLITHLPRRPEMHSLGVYTAGQPEGDYVVLTDVGDLWPFDRIEVAKRVEAYATDVHFEQISHGPLFAFRRR